MWVQPTILAPANGFSLCALFLSETRANISEKVSTGGGGSEEAERQGQKQGGSS